MFWKDLSVSDWNELSRARIQLHQAAQLIASVGISFVEHREDDSHTNLEWLPELGTLTGHIFGTGSGFRLGLSCSQLKYVLTDGQNRIISEFPLDGNVIDDGVKWLKKTFSNKGFDPSAFTLKRHYEIPDNAQARGTAFHLFSPAAFQALNDHFANAWAVLNEIQNSLKKVSPIRCWPHHFDMALLIGLEADDEDGPSKSIGVGLSPGDGTFDLPYFYVSPWPYPDAALLKDYPLPAKGFWHTTGFTAAILEAATYAASVKQENNVTDFLEAAISACAKILE